MSVSRLRFRVRSVGRDGPGRSAKSSGFRIGASPNPTACRPRRNAANTRASPTKLVRPARFERASFSSGGQDEPEPTGADDSSE